MCQYYFLDILGALSWLLAGSQDGSSRVKRNIFFMSLKLAGKYMYVIVG